MKVGDYVRTKYGVIARITDIIEDLSIDCDIDVYYENDLRDKMPMMEIPYNLKDEYIVKSSPNIIDLIEIGDYVNGCMVINKKDDTIQIIQLIIPFDLKEKDIKSIVTKEQFEAMQYKVGE